MGGFGSFNFGSLISGIGGWLASKEQAEGYKEQAKFLKEAGRVSLVSGKIKGVAIQRGIYQMTGAAKAAQGASGLRNTGSVTDVIRMNTQQGYLSKAVNVLNYQLEYKNYMSQAKQAESMADAAETSGIFSLIGGIAGMFSDDRLKTDIEFVGRRGDGVGIFRFNYTGDDGRYEGVMASEVAALRPDLVSLSGDGYQMVNYEALGVELRRLN